MATSTVSVADVLFGQAAPTEPSFRNKIIAFITVQRIAIGIMTVPIVIAPWALAGGRFTDPRLPFLLIVAWLVVTASNITNDIVDAERDKRKWPLRPIPTGLISRYAATLYVIIIAGIALVIAGLIFNWLFAVPDAFGAGIRVRLHAPYARQNWVSYSNSALGVYPCGSMDCFLSADRLHPTTLAALYFYCSLNSSFTIH